MTVEERIKLQREQKLIGLGYCTRVYCGKHDNEKDFPLFDEDRMEYYRLVADEVTDEQFQRIIAIGGTRNTGSSNRLASVLTVLGWINCVLLLVFGIMFGTPAGFSSSYNHVVLIGCCCGGIGGLLALLWFAEVLMLLQRIHDKL